MRREENNKNKNKRRADTSKDKKHNANTEKNYRVIFFVDSFIRVNVINLFIERIQQSPLMVKDNPEDKLTSSSDFSAIIVE